MCVCESSETTGQVKTKFHEEPPRDRVRKSKWFSSFIVLHYFQPSVRVGMVCVERAGAFSRDFTINLSLHCRAISRTLQT